jgi:hypothetical protein
MLSTKKEIIPDIGAFISAEKDTLNLVLDTTEMT